MNKIKAWFKLIGTYSIICCVGIMYVVFRCYIKNILNNQMYNIFTIFFLISFLYLIYSFLVYNINNFKELKK
jgi:hypothetical protein